jgi:hypothetical protein
MAKLTLPMRRTCQTLLALISLAFASGSLPANSYGYQEALERAGVCERRGDDNGTISNDVLAASLELALSVTAHRKLAALYVKVGRYSEAESVWQEILIRTKDLDVFCEYGAYLINVGNYRAHAVAVGRSTCGKLVPFALICMVAAVVLSKCSDRRLALGCLELTSCLSARTVRIAVGTKNSVLKALSPPSISWVLILR